MITYPTRIVPDVYKHLSVANIQNTLNRIRGADKDIKLWNEIPVTQQWDISTESALLSATACLGAKNVLKEIVTTEFESYEVTQVQECLNNLSNKGSEYPLIDLNGVYDEKTLSTLVFALDKFGKDKLLSSIN